MGRGLNILTFFLARLISNSEVKASNSSMSVRSHFICTSSTNILILSPCKCLKYRTYQSVTSGDFRDQLIIPSLPTRIYDPQIRLFRFGPSVEVAAYELAVLPLALEDFDADLRRLKADDVIDKASLDVSAIHLFIRFSRYAAQEALDDLRNQRRPQLLGDAAGFRAQD